MLTENVKRAVVWACALGEVVYNVLFEKHGVKEFLFKGFEDVKVPGWKLFPEVPEDVLNFAGSSKGLKGEEEISFLRYNYARLMMARLERQGKRKTFGYKTWEERATKAKDCIVNANLGLVVAMAKRFRDDTVEFSELISEGNMALVRTVDKFDVSRGFKFSTYACRSILAAFSRFASKAQRLRRRQVLVTDLGSEASLGSQAPTTHDDRDIRAEKSLSSLKEVIASNRADLSAIERRIISHRFGLKGETRKTLEQTSKVMGFSKERVRQIQNVALAKIKEAMAAVMN